jgi:hypothetical protein
MAAESARHDVHGAIEREASMRPRPNGRGKGLILGALLPWGAGFNEAAAKWPRKAHVEDVRCSLSRQLQ